MFSGLNKFIKYVLPKRLFYRALIIVAAPTIILQLIITIVFFDSLWIKTNRGMTNALVNELNTFIEIYNDNIYDKDEITNLFSVYQNLNIEYVEDNNFDYLYDEKDVTFRGFRHRTGQGRVGEKFVKKAKIVPINGSKLNASSNTDVDEKYEEGGDELYELVPRVRTSYNSIVNLAKHAHFNAFND